VTVGIVKATPAGIRMVVPSMTTIFALRDFGLNGDIQSARRISDSANPTPTPSPKAAPLVTPTGGALGMDPRRR